MAGELLSTLANFHQTKYRDILNSDVPRASKAALMLFNKARKIELGGTSLNTTWAHQTAEGVGFGALTEGGDYPSAGYDSAENPTLGMTHFAGSVRWSGHAIAAGNKTRYDGERLIRKKAKALTSQVKKYIARMFMWDGTDILCQAGAVSGTTNGYFTIKSGGCPIHFFEPGQVVTFRNAASSGSEQLTNASSGGGRVVAIDPDLGRVYLADITGGAADDYIAWANCYDASIPNGLRNLVDSGGTSVMGVDRTAAAGAFLRSIEIDHNSAGMSSTLVDELRDRIMDQAHLRGGKGNTSWVGNRKMRRWAAQATIGQNRFADLDLTLGVASVNVNDKDGKKSFVEDEYLIDGELFAVTWSKFVCGTPEGERGGRPVMNGSSPLFQATASSGDGYADAQMQYVTWRGNLGIDEGRCHGKATNIAAP